jgi:hypothetical protein
MYLPTDTLLVELYARLQKAKRKKDARRIAAAQAELDYYLEEKRVQQSLPLFVLRYRGG